MFVALRLINLIQSRIKFIRSCGKQKNSRTFFRFTSAAQKLQKDIQRLKWLLDPDSGKLEPVEADLYARIEGRVEKVQDRWAFIVINLGEKMPVIEHFKKGDKTRYLSLAQGFPITVARNLTSDEPEFVAKAVIVQVNDNCAVASIDKDSMQSEIKVGDSVYFTKENIAELLKLKEKMATSTKK